MNSIKEYKTLKYETVSEDGLNRFMQFLSEMEEETYPEFLSAGNAEIIDLVFERLVNQYSFPTGTKVLDIGCGQGEAMKLFEKNGFLTSGVTLNETDVLKCREKELDVYKMDQSFLNFPEEEFDLLWARHILEHSIFPYYTLWEYNRVLKKGGLIYIEVPAPGTVYGHENNINHYNVLAKNMWIPLFIKCGFEIVEHFEIPLTGPEGDDTYFSFVCKKVENRESRLKAIADKNKNNPLFLALSSGENFGWGVCSKYLIEEISKINPNTIEWEYISKGNLETTVEGKVFHALTGIEFESLSKVRGSENFGYTFFENELVPDSMKNAMNYDLIFGGSTWCMEKMKSGGINNVDVLIQGIDPQHFYPINEKIDDNLFVIFSGGKFELRKGQDLVLKAVKILQDKYPDIILINAWYNMWPKSMDLMRRTHHIRYENKSGNWIEFVNNLYELNGLDKTRIISNEIIPNSALREVYSKTHIGLFPNRCEGGTNLVLMEYMACGKPVVASYNSGHKDILTEQNSLMLLEQKKYPLFDGQNKLWADWEESSIDEIVSKLEFAYFNRDKIREIGKNAGEFMKNFTWRDSAQSLLSKIM